MRRKEREIVDIVLIEKIIRQSDVCRVAFADNNIPYIVTMNFGYSKEEKPGFFFHCAPSGRKIDLIKRNNLVCFQMDTDHSLTTGDKGCDWGMKYKSIVGYGRLSVVEDENEKRRGLDLIMEHYGGSGSYGYDPKVFSRTTLLYPEITEISAKEA